ncbi:MAG: inositol monophosphatase family protein [Candidatus Bathyarchaeia archaeon]
MTSWLSILEACSQKMKEEILPLFGSAEAQAGFGIGAGGDVIKKIDLAAENALIQTLQDYGVSCTLISEEAGTREIGSNPSSFYLTTDPLDGTTNAVRGAPFMAISLAVSKRPYLRDVETALVRDPVHDVTYTAERGKGAFRDHEGIQPSSTTSFEEAVMGVDFNTLKMREIMWRLIPLLERTKHLRHFGADALELCYVADGTTDAFIDIRGKLRVTDIAAAYLIIREAGGIMVTPEGSELDVALDATQRVAFIAAANKTIYTQIQKLLK